MSGIRPFIIPIFLPHAGCPHQCVFCNQIAITGCDQNPVQADHIRSHIVEYLEYGNKKRNPVQISFFGGNFLGLEIDRVELLLKLATEFVRERQVHSIRFSTRPDTISPERLDLIERYPIETVELGVQSMDDQVLALSKRGHCAADTIRAVHLLKERKFNIGLQIMVGLPGDTAALSLDTAQKIAGLQPNFIRIYPTLVVKNSRLARWYQKGAYTPLSLSEAVARVKKLYLFFKKCGIPVIRMGLQASEDLEDDSTILAGPYHPAFGHLVYSDIFYDAAQNTIESFESLSDTVRISVNPRSISKMRGLKNANITRLKERYKFNSIEIVADSLLSEEEMLVE